MLLTVLHASPSPVGAVVVDHGLSDIDSDRLVVVELAARSLVSNVATSTSVVIVLIIVTTRASTFEASAEASAKATRERLMSMDY
jgi:hypothetical protein